jgi:hypothetical protein
MPIDIQRIVSHVDVQTGDTPMSNGDLDRLAKLVLARLRELERSDVRHREATDLRNQASPPRWRGQ